MTGHLRKQSLASNANSSSSAFVLSKSSMTATHGTEKGVVIRNQDPKTAEGQHPIHSCNEKSTSVTMIVTSLFSFMSKYEYKQFGYKSKSISSHVQSNQSISRTSSNNLKFLRTKCYAQSNQPPPPLPVGRIN